MAERKIQNLPMKTRLIAIGVVAGLLLLPTILFMVTASVDQTEYAIKKNIFTGKVDTSRVYEAGRYYLGFENVFIYFPATIENIEFTAASGNPLTARTKDGLALSLDISFQYKLIKDKVIDMYLEFGDAYESAFIRVARDVIRDVASNYTAISYFNNRTVIGDAMGRELDLALQEIYAEVPYFQLRNVDLPDEFEDALKRAEVARQEITIAQYEQQAALIRAQTAILNASAWANITLIQANASAQAFIILAQAQAQALNLTLTQQGEAYYAMAQLLGLNTTELLALLWILALMTGDTTWVIVGDSTPSIFLDPSTNSTSSGS